MRFLAVFAMLIFFAVPATAQTMQLELADNRVDITTGFNGTRVILFGTTTEADGADIVVTLKGPERTMMVRRKGRVFGAWMNNETIEYRRVPSYYDFAATMGGNVLSGGAPFLSENQIGVENLDFYPEDVNEPPEVLETFHDALIRGMQQKGFYPIRASEIQFINPGFFKVVFELPPGVPTGAYTAQAMLIRDGEVLSRETKNLQVGQVGFNARVYLFSENHSFFYGVFAVLMALFSGWAAFTFLRRD